MRIADILVKAGLVAGLCLTGLVTEATASMSSPGGSGYFEPARALGPSKIEIQFSSDGKEMTQAIYFAEGDSAISEPAEQVLSTIAELSQSAEIADIRIFCGTSPDQDPVLALERMEAVALGLKAEGMPAPRVTVETSNLASSL